MIRHCYPLAWVLISYRMKNLQTQMRQLINLFSQRTVAVIWLINILSGDACTIPNGTKVCVSRVWHIFCKRRILLLILSSKCARKSLRLTVFCVSVHSIFIRVQWCLVLLTLYLFPVKFMSFPTIEFVPLSF